MSFPLPVSCVAFYRGVESMCIYVFLRHLFLFWVCSDGNALSCIVHLGEQWCLCYNQVTIKLHPAEGLFVLKVAKLNSIFEKVCEGWKWLLLLADEWLILCLFLMCLALSTRKKTNADGSGAVGVIQSESALHVSISRVQFSIEWMWHLLSLQK